MNPAGARCRHHLRGDLEQQGVENSLVLQRAVGDPRRQGGDDMEISAFSLFPDQFQTFFICRHGKRGEMAFELR